MLFTLWDLTFSRLINSKVFWMGLGQRTKQNGLYLSMILFLFFPSQKVGNFWIGVITIACGLLSLWFAQLVSVLLSHTVLRRSGQKYPLHMCNCPHHLKCLSTCMSSYRCEFIFTEGTKYEYSFDFFFRNSLENLLNIYFAELEH